MRKLTTPDRILDEAQQFLLALWGGHRAQTSLDELLDNHEPPPSHPQGGEPASQPSGRNTSANLLRVDHSGEVAAQALYRGQALTTADARVRADLLRAAEEEIEHLVWCEQRLAELGDRSSRLAPCWYLGSFTLGACVGVLAPRHALGFIEETEVQVAAHLEDHLRRLPRGDWRSATLLAKMRDDELRHAHWARGKQARRPRAAIGVLMMLCSQVMTRSSYRI